MEKQSTKLVLGLILAYRLFSPATDSAKLSTITVFISLVLLVMFVQMLLGDRDG